MRKRLLQKFIRHLRRWRQRDQFVLHGSSGAAEATTQSVTLVDLLGVNSLTSSPNRATISNLGIVGLCPSTLEADEQLVFQVTAEDLEKLWRGND